MINGGHFFPEAAAATDGRRIAVAWNFDDRTILRDNMRDKDFGCCDRLAVTTFVPGHARPPARVVSDPGEHAAESHPVILRRGRTGVAWTRHDGDYYDFNPRVVVMDDVTRPATRRVMPGLIYDHDPIHLRATGPGTATVDWRTDAGMRTVRMPDGTMGPMRILTRSLVGRYGASERRGILLVSWIVVARRGTRQVRAVRIDAASRPGRVETVAQGIRCAIDTTMPDITRGAPRVAWIGPRCARGKARRDIDLPRWVRLRR